MLKYYKTGEKCSSKGTYRWVKYTDSPEYSPKPTTEEMEIPLDVGEVFPPVKSCNRGCYREKK